MRRHRGEGPGNRLIATCATDAQIAVRVKQMTEFKQMYKNPLVNIALTFLEPLPVGILFTLVTSGC